LIAITCCDAITVTVIVLFNAAIVAIALTLTRIIRITHLCGRLVTVKLIILFKFREKLILRTSRISQPKCEYKKMKTIISATSLTMYMLVITS
jgi:uncharacterized membrane protein